MTEPRFAANLNREGQLVLSAYRLEIGKAYVVVLVGETITLAHGAVVLEDVVYGPDGIMALLVRRRPSPLVTDDKPGLVRVNWDAVAWVGEED